MGPKTMFILEIAKLRSHRVCGRTTVTPANPGSTATEQPRDPPRGGTPPRGKDPWGKGHLVFIIGSVPP